MKQLVRLYRPCLKLFLYRPIMKQLPHSGEMSASSRRNPLAAAKQRLGAENSPARSRGSSSRHGGGMSRGRRHTLREQWILSSLPRKSLAPVIAPIWEPCSSQYAAFPFCTGSRVFNRNLTGGGLISHVAGPWEWTVALRHCIATTSTGLLLSTPMDDS